MQILEDIIATFGSAQEARQATLFDTTKVVEFLAQNENYKKAYFTQVGDVLVFEKERFLALLATRNLDSSYTKFSNKIGLGYKNTNTFIKAQNEVVLHFPYKDCILKGAQDKDKAKSQEIFFNEILAREEIDVLFEPKVLCHFELIESNNHSQNAQQSQSINQSINQWAA
ncbi:site-specific DNA-methyltransferase [uncultured Helicobacter sp.]|uniref:site-specific DNA-methyltransferase n=1 Tax=uncultured Helicobacter sp. TaxID=175537 RepID=UPI00374EB7FE